MSTEQALADLAYFAQRAVFPGLQDKNLTAPGTPWIVLGGSYAGQISAFTRIQYPDLFIGGLTSSGITTGLLDNWQFYDVIRRYGPPKCVQAQQQVTNLLDNIYASRNKTALSELKTALNVSQASIYPDIGLLLTSGLGAWEQIWNEKTNLYPFTGTYSSIALLWRHLHVFYMTDHPSRPRLILRSPHQPDGSIPSRRRPPVNNSLSPPVREQDSYP